MAEVAIWTPKSAAQRFTAARTSTTASQRLPGRCLAGSGESGPRSNTPAAPPKATVRGASPQQALRKKMQARSVSPPQTPAERSRIAHCSRRALPKVVPGQGLASNSNSSTQTCRVTTSKSPQRSYRSSARSASPRAAKKEPLDVAPARSQSVRAMSARRRAAEDLARDRAALLASEPAFHLRVLTMTGSVLALIPDARPSWTRAEVVAALNAKAPPPAGNFYKLIASGRPLAGALSLADIGRAGGSSMENSELYAVVISNDALPVFVEARDGLQCIPIMGLDEIAKLQKPSATVTLTFQAVFVLLGLVPAQAKSAACPSTDLWPTIRQELIHSPQEFLEKLIGFDADADPKGTCVLLNPFVENDDFAPEKVVRASKIAATICQWCHALHTYCRVAVATGLA